MGMLKRAMDWRKGPTSFPMKDVEGIPEEDRRELLLEINKVVEKNRISITPALFSLKANKRGIMLPIVVNLTAICILAAGLFGLYTLFRQKEQGLRDGRYGTASVEGRLIDTIRREYEVKIAEKEQGINAIKRRLQEIAEQRNTLQASMESKILKREEELQRELEEELEALRRKLRAEGASDEVIAEELRKMEEERTTFYEQTLSSFRNEAEAQRLQAEEKLQKMEREAAENLQQMNEEQEQLRVEMDEQLADSQEGLEAEQLKLALLTKQRDREAGISSQILGLYLSLRESIRSGALDRADRTLAQLKALLNDEAYFAVPSFRERRSAELFIVESLEKLLEKERQQLSEAAETSESALAKAALEADSQKAAPIAQTEAEEDTRRLADRAEALMEDGNYMEAVSAYLSLLIQYSGNKETDQLPEEIAGILETQLAELEAQRLQAEKALQSFEREAAEKLRQMNAEREQLRIELEERLAGSQEGLETAQSELAHLTEQQEREAGISSRILDLYFSLRESIRSGALDQADRTLAQLKALLNDEAYFAVPSFRERRSAELFIVESLEKLLEKERQQLSEAAETSESALAKAALEADSREAARRLADTAEAFIKDGNYVEAVSAYLSLLIQYPDSKETDQVPEGITSILQSYDQELLKMQQEAARLAAVAKERSGVIGSLEERRRILETRLAELESHTADTGVSDTVSDPLMQEELRQLRDIEAIISGLQQQYNKYVLSVDTETLSLRDEEQLLSSKQAFDAFLISPEAQEIMPGLLERIRIYDSAFERAGRKTALLDTVELVSELSMLSTPGERQAYIEKEKTSLREPEMIDFLEELFLLIQ